MQNNYIPPYLLELYPSVVINGKIDFGTMMSLVFLGKITIQEAADLVGYHIKKIVEYENTANDKVGGSDGG